MTTFKPQDCNHYDTCSANICPLYDRLQRRDGTWLTQHKNDPSCSHCRAITKNSPEAIPENIRQKVIDMYPIMFENCGAEFRSAMNKASKSPMKKVNW